MNPRITVVFFALTFLAPDVSIADGKNSDVLKFMDARIFMTLKGTTTTAGYVQIENTTNSALVVKILAVASFKAAEIHETVDSNGQMMMRKKEFIEIAPHAKSVLKPGAQHIMLFDSPKSLKIDDTVNVTFGAQNREYLVPFKIVPRVLQK